MFFFLFIALQLFAFPGSAQIFGFPAFMGANVTFDPQKISINPAVSALKTRNVSSNPCHAELIYGLNHFLNTHDRSLLTFLSYTGGPLNEVGKYRECLAHGGKFFHMVVSLGFPLTVNGLCLPCVCAVQDLTFIRQSVADILRAVSGMAIGVDNVAIYDVEALNEHYFRTTPGIVVTYAIFVVLATLCLAGTICTLLFGNELVTAGVRRVAKCFDLIGNFKGLLVCENAVDPNLNVLNGVRVLGMGWVIFGHTFEVLFGFIVPIFNLGSATQLIQSSRIYATYVAGTLSVDVFFFLTGFLGVLVCEHQFKSSPGGKVRTALMMYAHRFVRIVPLYGLTILFGHTLFPTLYDGPFYFQVGRLIDHSPCERNWYLNLLFINNFVEASNNCLGWSWYLSNDFQMYLLIPWLCLLYRFRKLFALLSLAIMLVVSVICQIIVFIHFDISLDVFRGLKQEYISEYYIKVYCRVAPFLLGVLFAWMYQAHKSPARGPSVFVSLNHLIVSSSLLRSAMYVCGAGIMWCCVYLFFEFYKSGAVRSVGAEILYAILTRPAFVIGMMMIVYPAVLGKNRVTQRILGHELFSFMSKLTFAAYLFHPYVTVFYFISMEESVYFTGRKIVVMGLEAVAISYFVAMILALLVEYPTTLLSKEYLRPVRKQISEGKATEKTKGEVDDGKQI